jgi:lipopolysaccharide transport system permease protein
VTRDLRLYFGRLWQLTLCEYKLREQSTLLGFLWTLLQPLLLFSVLYGLFTRWMIPRTQDYAAYLLIGIVQYGFFSGGSSIGLTSLARRSGLLINFTIPRELVVLSTVASVAISYLLELALVLVFVAVGGVRPHAAWLLLPVLVALHLALVVGVSLWVSVVAARFPDWERIWSILMTAGFFLTPIFYTLDSVSPRRRAVLRLNPMTHIIELTRGVLLRGEAPSVWTLAAIAAGVTALCAAGWAFFKRHESDLADWVAV